MQSNAFWKDQNNHRKFFDWLGKKLHVKTMEDWYHIGKKDVCDNGGGKLLTHHYNSSHMTALENIYHEHNWIPWKFTKSPHGFWNDKNNHLKFFDWLGKELGFKTMDDWYQLSQENVVENGGGGFLYLYAG